MLRHERELIGVDQRPAQRSRTALLVAEVDLAEIPGDTLRQSGGGDIGACRVLAGRISNALAGSLADAGVSIDEVMGARAVSEVLRYSSSSSWDSR